MSILRTTTRIQMIPRRQIHSVGLVLLFGLLALMQSCSSQAEQPASLAPDHGSAFQLDLYPDTFIAGGSADEISVREVKGAIGEVRVEVVARNASRLKAVFFRLNYDAASFTPLRLNKSENIAPADGDLSIYLPATPGVLEFAQMLPRPQDQVGSGFSGNGVLCSIDFARRPFADVQRATSGVPSSDDARSTLVFNPVGPQLEWRLVNPGDYSQDGQVLASDLTPIGIHFNEDVPAGNDLDGRDSNSIQDVVDGNNDGTIAVGDLTAIGLNFQDKILRYKLFRSTDPLDVPTSNTGPNGPGTLPLGTVELSEAIGNKATERLRFEFVLLNDPAGAIYWVRPFDGVDDGTPSTTALGGAAANQPPVAAIVADVTQGFAPLTVNFDASASADEAGLAGLEFSWDFEGDGTFDFVSGSDATISHDYTDPGQFNPTVKATDSEGLNGLASVEVLVDTPGNVPPTANLVISAVGTQAPVAITLDASGSADTDGTIQEYRFDLDGDGEFEKVFAGTEDPVLNFNLGTNGSYTFTVQVIDDDQGTDSDSKTADVSGGFVPAEVDQLDPGVEPLDIACGAFNKDPSANSRFLVAYMDDTKQLKHLVSNDNEGESWKNPALVTASGSDERNAALHLGVVGGLPVLAYIDNASSSGTLRYVRANDADGLSWPNSTALASGSNLRSPFLRIVDGVPAVAYMLKPTTATGNSTVFFVNAKNSVGSGAWNGPVLVDNGFPQDLNQVPLPRLQLLFVSGDQEPAVVVGGAATFREKADNKKGDDWDGDADNALLFAAKAFSYQLESGDEAIGAHIQDNEDGLTDSVVSHHVTNAFGAFSGIWQGAFTEIETTPDISPLVEFRRDGALGVVCWHDNDLNALKFARSLNADAEAYGAPQVIDFVDTDVFDMTVMGSTGRVLIVYYDKAQGVIKAANI